jgi:RNA polymerase sigma-B factor
MPHLQTTQRRSSVVHEHDGPSRAYARLEPLLAEYSATTMDNHRRRQLQTELTIGFLPLVHHIARRYAGRGEPTADLEQAGAIGLLHALRRFDPTRGNDFLSFAIPTITGEIRRHFRDRAWAMRVPRRYKDRQAPIREAVAALSGTLGRAPKPSEIAAELGEPVQEIIEALGASQAYCLDSLDSPAHGSDQGLGDTLGMVDSALDTVEYRESLRANGRS